MVEWWYPSMLVISAKSLKKPSAPTTTASAVEMFLLFESNFHPTEALPLPSPHLLCAQLSWFLVRAVLRQPLAMQQLLAAWLADLPAEVFGPRVVQPWVACIGG